MRSNDVEELRREWVLAAKRDRAEVGWWWAAQDVRDRLGSSADWNLVRATTLDALTPLLRSGQLRAVDLLLGGRIAAWPGLLDEWLRRMDHEWQALGRDPRIGDIVWFLAPE